MNNLQLPKTLGILAATAEDQLRYLDNLGLDYGDVSELALEFDDDLPIFLQHAPKQQLTNSLTSILGQIDAIFQQLGDDHASWTPLALKNSPKWEEIRKLSKEALILIGS